MKLLLSTLTVSFVSALLPFVNVEVYLGAVGTRTAVPAALALALAASVGQTLGKAIWYAVARRSIETAWVQRKLARPKTRVAYDRWQARIEGRPWYAAAILFASASLGVPPLLIMATLAGALRMRFWVFAVSCFVGRALRFYFILVGVSFFTH